MLDFHVGKKKKKIATKGAGPTQATVGKSKDLMKYSYSQIFI